MQLPYSKDDPEIIEIRRRAFENALAACGYKRSYQDVSDEGSVFYSAPKKN